MANDVSKSSKSGTHSRRFLWLGAFVVLVCLAWSAGWSWMAGRIEAFVPVALADAGRNGVEPRCENPDVRGFPFRLGLFCDRIRLDIPGNGVSASAGEFRSAAQVYNPRHVVSELDGPLVLDGTDGLAVQADWQLLHASTVMATDSLDRASIEGRSVSFNLDGPGLPARISALAERLAFHVRRNATALDVAISGEAVSSPLAPDVKSIALDASIPDGATMIAGPVGITDLRGKTVVVRDMALALAEGGSLSAAGEVSVSPEGLLSGNLKLKIVDVTALAGAVARHVPQIGDDLTRYAPLVSALDMEPGDDAVTLPLVLRDGNMAIGMLPLGRAPRL